MAIAAMILNRICLNVSPRQRCWHTFRLIETDGRESHWNTRNEFILNRLLLIVCMYILIVQFHDLSLDGIRPFRNSIMVIS